MAIETLRPMKDNFIFLTIKETVRAICADFKQYHPQPMLFAGVLRLISGGTLYLKRDPGKDGAWINQPGKIRMVWLAADELVAFMCKAITDTKWNTDLLAAVGQRVFQSSVVPAVDPDTGKEGVRIETNMAAYHCRQCGHCCRSLDYHHEVTDRDVSRWRDLGREDILNWVAVTRRGDAAPAYRIWVCPETHQLADPCPFLKKDPTTPRWQCLIHDVKPDICRHYPVSRKHALMTGCQGFNGIAPK